MNELEQAVRERLLRAVPEIAAPADRVQEVRQRVRRSRQLTTIVGGGVAALALTGAVALVPAADAPTTTIDCAAVPIATARPADRAGDLVPAGAVSVTRCETGFPEDPSAEPTAAGPANQVPGKTVTVGVERIVAAANALPRPSGEARCTLVGYARQLTLVFAYRDGRQVVVLVDRNCRTLSTTERTRDGLGPVTLFDSLWSEQNGGADPVVPRPS